MLFVVVRFVVVEVEFIVLCFDMFSFFMESKVFVCLNILFWNVVVNEVFCGVEGIVVWIVGFKVVFCGVIGNGCKL